MTYKEHLKENFKVGIKCIILALFHILHGIIPCKYTEHEYWIK